MFLLEGTLHWSASDLTAAVDCEYGLLRTLDYKLGRAEKVEVAEDPFQEHIARLGDHHEERLLATFRDKAEVAEIAHIEPPYTQAKIAQAREDTLAAFEAKPDIVYQAAFSDGEFFGYADFIERADDGWLVCDAKLAREAKPKALIQLGAYADQIQRLGLPLSDTVSLLLGNGERVDARVSDVLPVFIERRERLREVLAEHQNQDAPIAWGDERYSACGRCPECKAAAEATDDVILVAGMRRDQRTRLRAAGITTVSELADATTKPEGMSQALFDKVRAQAAMQRQQTETGEVSAELTATAPAMLQLLPAPSPGDLFFDFEGDPLYDEGDPGRAGLEYLWGVLDTHGVYTPTWAHSWEQEREAFIAFIEDLMQRRMAHPDMHVYHYAPYETSALKRLAIRYQTHEAELDQLLRGQVFVDLYATVRGSVRVSQPSYSIKKLEPLYMGDQLRESDVADGAGSIIAYRQYHDMVDDDPAAAADRLTALADYNEYDCLSTLRLRDWLLERAEEAGVRDLIVPRINESQAAEETEEGLLFESLMSRSGPDGRAQRSPEEQAYAMLAASLGYYRRENKQYWWEHYDRMSTAIADWSEARDLFIVESAEVVADWQVPEGKATNARRTVRLTGDWTPGSNPSSQLQAVYEAPAPAKVQISDAQRYGVLDVEDIEVDPRDVRAVLIRESCKPADTYPNLPVAIVPGVPPRADNLVKAITETASASVMGPVLPSRSALDLLARRRPRLAGGAALPASGSPIEDVVEALTAMDDSYLAIQGPPGTGKTYTGSRVIKNLVEKHGWRIGVVAQSHAVVENMLNAVVKAGLDPDLVGKAKVSTKNPAWTVLRKVSAFVDSHASSGCVVGGTAWDFANNNTIPQGSLDLLVVDEAGQFSLAPTIAVSVAAKRLLLLGDPQQLPQVSQGTHPEPVDQSALGWLMEGHDTIPAGYGYFLAESYRMHPEVCAKVSTLSYSGRLQSAPAASKRSLDAVLPGLEVVMVPHLGNSTASPEEAAEVVAQATKYLGSMWHDPDESSGPRPLGQQDVLVVAPYNAQVGLIRRALAAAGLSEVRVGTVDKFQGQEAPITIVSMTASSDGDVPRGMGFLLNRNRINVAVSRAQWRAIVIRSHALTAFMPGSAQGVQELGAFIGLCQA